MNEVIIEKPQEKKPYTTPTLTTHGEVVKVTLQIVPDGSGIRMS